MKEYNKNDQRIYGDEPLAEQKLQQLVGHPHGDRRLKVSSYEKALKKEKMKADKLEKRKTEKQGVRMKGFYDSTLSQIIFPYIIIIISFLHYTMKFKKLV